MTTVIQLEESNLAHYLGTSFINSGKVCCFWFFAVFTSLIWRFSCRGQLNFLFLCPGLFSVGICNFQKTKLDICKLVYTCEACDNSFPLFWGEMSLFWGALTMPSVSLSFREHKSLHVHRIWYVLLMPANGLIGKTYPGTTGVCQKIKAEFKAALNSLYRDCLL